VLCQVYLSLPAFTYLLDLLVLVHEVTIEALNCKDVIILLQHVSLAVKVDNLLLFLTSYQLQAMFHHMMLVETAALQALQLIKYVYDSLCLIAVRALNQDLMVVALH